MQPFRIQQIVFPTDFSRPSECAAPHVAGLAKAMGASVSILHVVPWLSGWHGASEPYYAISDDVQRKLKLNQQAAEESCLKMLETIRERFFKELRCNISVKTGGVAESVVEHAAELNADLIAMPTRGTGPARPFLIGSATAKVLYDARCAVWTTPHPRELDEFRPYRRIICAMDYRFLSRDLLIQAWQVAQLFKSSLSAVTAIPCPAATSIPCKERQPVRLLKTETESTLRGALHELSIEASVHVLEGPVGEAVQQVVDTEQADLVVTGRGHLDERGGYLHTHIYEVIWHSPCPVLSF